MTASTRTAIANANSQLDIVKGIKRGLADGEAGRVVPHAQATAEARELIAELKRRKSARG